MCHTIQESVLANVLFFLREQSRDFRQSIEDHGCIMHPWSRGRYCSGCLASFGILEVIDNLQKRPLNSWGRRSWVFAARESQKAHDKAHSGLGAFWFDFSWLLWLASRDALGCISGPSEAALRDAFNQAYDTITFHWDAAQVSPFSEDYFAARSAAVWMEGR